MKTTIVLVVVLAMASFYLIGCGQSPEEKAASKMNAALKELYKPRQDTDVTSSPRYNFSSFAGTVWKTKVKMAVGDVKRYTDEHAIDLFPPDAFDPTDPKYNPVPNMQIIAVLPVGTRLRIERLMKDNGVWGGVQVAATLEDGTNSQKAVYLDRLLLANNRFIHLGPTSSTNWGVNPDMLEK